MSFWGQLLFTSAYDSKKSPSVSASRRGKFPSAWWMKLQREWEKKGKFAGKIGKEGERKNRKWVLFFLLGLLRHTTWNGGSNGGLKKNGDKWRLKLLEIRGRLFPPAPLTESHSTPFASFFLSFLTTSLRWWRNWSGKRKTNIFYTRSVGEEMNWCRS